MVLEADTRRRQFWLKLTPAKILATGLFPYIIGHLLIGINYGNPPATIFLRGCGKRELHPRRRARAGCPAFVVAADHQAGRRAGSAAVRPPGTQRAPDHPGADFSAARAGNFE